jgi:hypothetical protein
MMNVKLKCRVVYHDGRFFTSKNLFIIDCPICNIKNSKVDRDPDTEYNFYTKLFDYPNYYSHDIKAYRCDNCKTVFCFINREYYACKKTIDSENFIKKILKSSTI